jgi:glycosyltransferase involved in cell wall biosynthesis
MTNAKLCVVTPVHWSAEMGGAEYQIKLLLHAIAARGGFDVTYLARSVDSHAQTETARVIRLTTPKFVSRYGWFFDAPSLYWELKRLRPDCIYQRVGCAYTGVVAHYARRTGCRTVWHVAHDDDVVRARPELKRDFVFKFIEKKCLEYGVRRIQTIVVQTRHQADLLRANYGREPAAVIANFHPRPDEKIVKVRRPIRILWIANLKANKQPEVFVKLARDLRDRADVKLTILGNADHSSGRQARFLGDVREVPNLEYLGAVSQSEVNQRLAEAHLLVNTSRAEGFSNAFIQAWMRKVPVVSLNADPDGIIRSEGIGFFARGNYASLLYNTRRLIEDESLRNDMGDRAQRYAFRNHSMQSVDRLIEMLGGAVDVVPTDELTA